MTAEKPLTHHLRGIVELLPEGEALVGWKNIAKAMSCSVTTAKRVAQSDPTFPRKRFRGRVYVLVPEFMAWWSAQSGTGRAV